MPLNDTHNQSLLSARPPSNAVSTSHPGHRMLGGALLGTVLAAATLFTSSVAWAGSAGSSRPVIGADPALTLVAEGCGPGRWRGPWGGCNGAAPWGWHGGPVYGPVYGGNGCPPGFWRGPWGHCRDTPYHGRLPGGGWK